MIAIVEALIGTKRSLGGASLLLAAAVTNTGRPIAVTYSELGLDTALWGILALGLFARWWAYGLVIAGFVGIILNRRSEAGAGLRD